METAALVVFTVNPSTPLVILPSKEVTPTNSVKIIPNNQIEVEFKYNQRSTKMQCKLNDKIKNIYMKNLNKIGDEKDINNIYFLYKGDIYTEDISFEEMINPQDKKEKKMTILVETNGTIIKENDHNHSKDVICPKCGESIKFDIIDYKINLYDCKNGHKIDNILLNEFENTQNKLIKCEICNDNKKIFKCLE